MINLLLTENSETQDNTTPIFWKRDLTQFHNNIYGMFKKGPKLLEKKWPAFLWDFNFVELFLEWKIEKFSQIN